MPHRLDGEIIEPRVSVPIANPTRPAAVAEPEPAEEVAAEVKSSNNDYSSDNVFNKFLNGVSIFFL